MSHVASQFEKRMWITGVSNQSPLKIGQILEELRKG
jgi:hypothetical protein